MEFFKNSNKSADRFVSENLSKITIRDKKLELKVQNHNLASNKHLNIY